MNDKDQYEEITFPIALGLGGHLKFSDDALKDFQKRVQEAGVPMEFGNPKQKQGQSAKDYFDRLNEIHLDNVCGVLTDFKQDADGHLVGEMKLAGPKAEVLKEIMDKKIPYAFGVRAFLKPNSQEVQKIISYDMIPHHEV